MSSYLELSKAFGNKQKYFYDGNLSCDGTKILCSRGDWAYNNVTKKWGRTRTNSVVLAEWVEHKGKPYAVVYNRGNKCFATDALWYHNARYQNWGGKSKHVLKYGELGKPVETQQVSYRCQMIDALIGNGAVTHILIPTSYEGDSEFFKKL